MSSGFRPPTCTDPRPGARAQGAALGDRQTHTLQLAACLRAGHVRLELERAAGNSGSGRVRDRQLDTVNPTLCVVELGVVPAAGEVWLAPLP